MHECNRCKLILERLYLFLDGEVLSEEERQEIRNHIDECLPCYERYGLEREIAIIVRRVGGAECCPQALRSKIIYLLRS